ncbi:hypothetical protein OY671_008004, partial [Metschnikowia pulcherrima]
MIVGAEGEVARVQALKHDMCIHMQQRHQQMAAQIQANCEIVYRLMAGNFSIETPPEFEKVQQATREAADRTRYTQDPMEAATMAAEIGRDCYV